MTDNAEKKDGKKVGALHSELQIDLHTYYAISTWEGRERGARKDTIIGMPRFFRLVSSISRDSLADNPYADAVMYQLKKLIDEAHKNIQHLLNEPNSIIADLPSGISLSSVVSSSPLNIGVHSHTPLGYRCVYLLVGFDQLALKLFQAHHYGFISRQHRDDQLHKGGYQIRKIFSATSTRSSGWRATVGSAAQRRGCIKRARNIFWAFAPPIAALKLIRVFRTVGAVSRPRDSSGVPRITSKC